MKWSEKAWKNSEGVYNQILELPFIKELANGSLAQEKFWFYLRQDAIYLAEYAKVLAGIATRLEDPKHRESFLIFSSTTIGVEIDLHNSYLKDAPAVAYKGPSPSCLLYTGFLAQQLQFYPVETAAAAVLPCFWIYQKVGDHILEHQSKSNNPYQAWINTYGGEEFALATEKAIDICDYLANKSPLQTEMTEAFLYSAKMEWQFWDSAYKLEEWPV